MTALETIALKLYEEAGMSPAEIAEDQGVDELAVKTSLSMYSTKYREDTKENPNIAFSSQEREMARRVITDLMQFAEDEDLKFKAARYVRDDSEGRLDNVPAALRKLKGSGVTIVAFNARMQQALASIERTRKLGEGKEEKVIEAEVVGK